MPPFHPQGSMAVELRLIVPASEPSSSDAVIALDGRHWRLTEPLDLSSPETLPKYVCISYIWGQGKAPSPFDVNRSISNQTMSALEIAMATMRDSEVDGFWIDAICVPSSAAAVNHRATLESMGFIYSCAAEVVVTLSAPTFSVVEQASRLDVLDDEALQILEQDRWVASCWTYQEIVNSIRIRFVSQNRSAAGSFVEGEDFFNCVGYSMVKYGQRHRLNGFEVNERLPRVSALEDTVADWRVSNFLERSALQVMGNVNRRVCRVGEPQNYYYAMMGAITKTPTWDTANGTVVELSDKFMTLCEQEKDYSFIYSSAERDTVPGRRWRPRPGTLKPIISWHTNGGLAGGYHDSAGFWLSDMVTYDVFSELGGFGKDSIQRSLLSGLDLKEKPDDEIARMVYMKLVSIFFTGLAFYVNLGEGLFFPQTPLHDASDRRMLISGSISWGFFGAPGLAVYYEGHELVECVPGVFIGHVHKEKAVPVLIDPMAAARREEL